MNTQAIQTRSDIKKVWEGWKWAQHCITEDLVNIHISRDVFQGLGKEARKNRDKSMGNLSATAIKNLNHQEAILRMVANSMVWTMFGMERWKVRWLWTAGPRVPVNSIGLQTSTFVDNINDNPDSVALMADITSLVGVSGGDILGRVGGEIADIWRLNTVPSTVIHRVIADPLDGARDVQRGRISAGSPGGDGGGNEHPGSLPGIWVAPGHGAQDAGLLGAARVSTPKLATSAQA